MNRLGKYVDRGGLIEAAIGAYGTAEAHIVKCTLNWLDDHPGQVPGPAITMSGRDAATELFTPAERSAWTCGFEAAGGRVVADTEITNEERLVELLEKVRGADHVRIAGFLNKHGVIAPKGRAGGSV